jgi:hypothetical protein
MMPVMQDQPCGDPTAGPSRQQVPPTRPAPLLIQQDSLPAVWALLHRAASGRATERNRRGKVSTLFHSTFSYVWLCHLSVAGCLLPVVSREPHWETCSIAMVTIVQPADQRC